MGGAGARGSSARLGGSRHRVGGSHLFHRQPLPFLRQHLLPRPAAPLPHPAPVVPCPRVRGRRASRRGRSTPNPTPQRKPSSKKLPELIAATVGEQASGKQLEIWFQDEARIGQKGELTRQWVRRGSRPRQPRDQRYAAAYVFAAVCPAAEKTAALVCRTSTPRP